MQEQIPCQPRSQTNQNMTNRLKTDHSSSARKPRQAQSRTVPAPAKARTEKSACFGHLKQRLVQDRLTAVGELTHAMQIRWAAEEAAALAWASGYPLLVFPVLFEEYALTAVLRARRQEIVHQRSRELLGLAPAPEATPV